MSEAELHVLRARLRGGILNKAQRAALRLPLPMGLAYAEDETVILDPDAQIQQAIGMLFTTFKRTGSATATVKYFRTKALLFPRRVRTGPHAGEVHWGPLLHSTTRHPSFAILATQGPSAMGALARRNSLTVRIIPRPFPRINGSFSSVALTLGISPGRSMKRICSSCSRIVPQTREDRRHGPAREGPALLQGLVICGRCGNRMTLRYYQRKHGIRLYPEYLCQKEQIEQAGDRLCRASCLVRAWMRRSPICCWRN